jgi:Carboxypeptidase regulatory-like domain/TonB dependent receptor
MYGKTVSSWVPRALFAAVVVIVLAGATPLYGQVDTGSILGTVTDSSGATVNAASVTLTNQGTNAALTTTTGSDGVYKFTPVKIGTYKIKVSLQGFQTLEKRDISVDVGQNVVVDFALKPGSVSETIEVASTVPVLETQDASVGQVVDRRNVDQLPLNGRNFTFLAQLAAGVNSPQADTRGNAATGAFAANGDRPAQNNYLLDGIDNNSDTVDFLNGTNFVVLPPVDAIQEFKVQTSDFSAEFGRSGAAVLNATIKQGTNEFHGDVWEFFRNDKLDAADFFENAGNVPKGELRQNQFGFTAGGPVVIPKLFNGKDKLFIFGDYEGLRRVQGTVLNGQVPTALERSSGYTNLTDLINLGPGGTQTDALGRTVPTGTVFDPATTRAVTAGVVDPVSGLLATSSGFVRDPFGTCGPSTKTFTLATCNLNNLSAAAAAGRIDANAIKLLNLYPNPTSSGLVNNFTNSPKLFEHRNSFDTRLDANFNQNNQMFFRFSLNDDPQFIPGIFGGVADGGGFQQGTQTAIAEQSALAYTHTFSPNLINELRAGLNFLQTSRVSPDATNLTDLPGQFGIAGIPQQTLNGGLPAFGINGLQTLGSNAFLPSDEVTSTFQLTDDVTKILGKHTFKMGFEWQHVKFSTLQPPWSRGEFDFGGGYTDIPNNAHGNTGIAQFLLVPEAATVANGIGYVGGPNSVFVSNISLTDNGKDYYGGYVNDDWKVSSKLTVNLGVRYDFFGLVGEHHENQANFVPTGPPLGGPAYIIPPGKNSAFLTQPVDCTNAANANFLNCLLAKDGITLAITDKYGQGLGNSQKTNFAPRIGLAYQVSPKLVLRTGFGIFYNGFENRGFSPNIGENYPFQFNFSFFNPDAGHAINNFAGCATATPAGGPTLETGFTCTPLNPLLVNASGLSLRGIQFDYSTPYTMGANVTLQYQLTSTMSVQAGYVTSLARHLETFPGNNNVTSIQPTSVDVTTLVPFPDFGRGNSQADPEGMSAYHGLQTKVEKQFKGGLSFLATYTWSKTMSDSGDLLNGGADNVGYRAPSVPGFGIKSDYSLANFDIRNVFHFSGGYELPFGKGKRFMSGLSNGTDKLVGGWAIVWSSTLQGGQPIRLGCPSTTAQGLGCGALFTGQPLDLGIHTDANGILSWFGNPLAFSQPCVLGTNGPTGCVPLTGVGALGGVTQVPGPGFHRLDFSLFKEVALTERYRLQFRAEMFNILNHPNFNAPGFGGNGVVAIAGSTDFTNTGAKTTFGEIGSTRDAPYDPRQIQFALKFYY